MFSISWSETCFIFWLEKFENTLKTFAQAKVEHMMAVLKHKRVWLCTLLSVFRDWSAAMSPGFPLTLWAFHVGHPWTPFPVFLPEHVALKHAILSAQVILRTGYGNSECASCVYVHWLGGGLKWDMLGITPSTKKCHMIWSTGLIYLASERICCMWFGGVNVFPLCSLCAQTQHMETFSERPWVYEKKRKTVDVLFLLSAFRIFLFKLIELHTSADHMHKNPSTNEYLQHVQWL